MSTISDVSLVPYIAREEIWDYLRAVESFNINQKTILNKKNMLTKNFINFDSNFCCKANNLKMSKIQLLKYLHRKGISDGIIFHPKQLKNYNKNIEILEDNDKNLYVKENKNIYLLSNYCDHIYSKNLYSFLSEFDMIKVPDHYKDTKIVVILFWGNNKIGEEILNKLKYMSFKFNLLVVLRNGLNYKFDDNTFVIKVKEYGNDIIPSLIGYNFLNQLINFSYVIKLHTKQAASWRVPLVNFFLKKSEDNLIKLLENNEFICANKFVRLIGFRLIEKSDFNDFYKKEDCFPAGSMFMVRKLKYDSIIIFMLKYGYLKYFLQNMYDNHTILKKKSPIHFLERLVGVNLDKLLLEKIDSNNLKPEKLKKVVFSSNNVKLNKNNNLKIDNSNRQMFNGKICINQEEYKNLFQKKLENRLNLERKKSVNLPFEKIKELRNVILKEINKEYAITKKVQYHNKYINVNLNNVIVKKINNQENNNQENNNQEKNIRNNSKGSKKLFMLNRIRKLKKINTKPQTIPNIKPNIKQTIPNIEIKSEIKLETKLETKIDKQLTEYFGWKYILENINRRVSNNNILLISNVEKYFIIMKNKKIERKWFGFIHEPEDIPMIIKDYYINLKDLFNNKNFNDSLENCVGLVSFSSNICVRLSNNLDVNIYSLRFPISIPKSILLKNSENNTDVNLLINNKNLLFLGEHYRRHHLMFKINNYNKIWVPKVDNKILSDRKKIIECICSKKKIKVNWDLIKIESYNNYEEYFDKLRNNIVLITSYNLNSDNSILDVIALKIPALIERNRSTMEYIGEDYPGFFDVENLIDILNNRIKLVHMLRSSKSYLENNYKKLLGRLSFDLFVNSINFILNPKKLLNLFLLNSNLVKLLNRECKILFEDVPFSKLLIDYYGDMGDMSRNMFIELMERNINKNIILTKDGKVILRVNSGKYNLYNFIEF